MRETFQLWCFGQMPEAERTALNSDAFHVFLHTNRPIRTPPNDIHVSTGWWAQTHDMRPFEKGTRNSKFSRDEFPYHSKFASHQAFKYQWLSKLSSGATLREPWLLMDTDTVVQCSAVELRARFAALGSPLVVGESFNGGRSVIGSTTHGRCKLPLAFATPTRACSWAPARALRIWRPRSYRCLDTLAVPSLSVDGRLVTAISMTSTACRRPCC
jgi:hypothetical protein